jgi:integrase
MAMFFSPHAWVGADWASSLWLVAVGVMAAIFKRPNSDNWWVRYSYCGSKKRESCGSPSRKAAEALLRKRLGEIGRGQLIGPAVEKVRVSELLGDLETEYTIMKRPSLITLRGQIAALMPLVGHLRAVDVSTALLRSVVERWQADNAAPATINKRMTTLRRAFNLGRRATPPKVMTVPEFPRLPEHNAREGFFEKGEFFAVLSHIEDPGLRDFLEWAFWTGMRKGEISKLEWSAFDRETWLLTLPGRITKNRRPRRIALEGPLRAIVERRLEARRLDCRLIFWRQHEGAPTSRLQPGMPVRIYEFRKTWKTACRKAGIEAGKAGRIFHDLRRTGVRNLRRAGVDRKVAMLISGHRSESVFERYNIDTDDDLREAVAKVASYVGGLPTTPTVVPLQVKAEG